MPRRSAQTAAATNSPHALDRRAILRDVLEDVIHKATAVIHRDLDPGHRKNSDEIGTRKLAGSASVENPGLAMARHRLFERRETEFGQRMRLRRNRAMKGQAVTAVQPSPAKA